MVQETMTVHRALAELKTLDARIQKGMAPRFAYENKHFNTTVNGLPIAEYNEQIKAAYRSVTDLMRRRDALKRAVVLSNAATKVTVAGVEYTVAEAIDVKNNSIPLMQTLLKRLQSDYDKAQNAAQNNNGDALENRADIYIKSLYGNTDLKNAGNEIKEVRANFISTQTMDVCDPIGIVDVMRGLEERINSFVVDIDSALSVSNAITEITVEY